MDKIATRKYIANLTANSGTNIPQDTRCATKSWTTTTYPEINITDTYSDNQLIKQKDLIYTPLQTILGPISGTYNRGTPLNSMFTKNFDKSKPFQITFSFTMHKIYSIDGMIFCVYPGPAEDGRTVQLMWYGKDWHNTGATIPFVGGYVTGASYMNDTSGVKLGTPYTFSLNYDGKTLTSEFNGTIKHTQITLTKDNPFNFMIAGSPHSSNGDCNITFNKLIIKN